MRHGAEVSIDYGISMMAGADSMIASLKRSREANSCRCRMSQNAGICSLLLGIIYVLQAALGRTVLTLGFPAVPVCTVVILGVLGIVCMHPCRIPAGALLVPLFNARMP